jgi:hypothetical protein
MCPCGGRPCPGTQNIASPLDSFEKIYYIGHVNENEVIVQLQQLNETTSKIYSVISKPQNKVVAFFAIFASFVGAMGIFTVVDVFLKWIIGGK